MARDGLPLIVCAGLVAGGLGFAGQLRSAPPDDRSATVAQVLAVQMALRQGRELLLQNNSTAAIELLERQLPYIDGDPNYLALLRDAYRTRIKELQLANQPTIAQAIHQRLAVLESLDAGTRSAPNTKAPVPTGPAPAHPAQNPPAATGYYKPQGETASRVPEAPRKRPEETPQAASTNAPGSAAPGVARGKMAEDNDDPFRPPLAERQKQARTILAEAEQAFAQSRYRDAGRLFARSNQLDPATVEPSRERWAYCLLHHVAEELKAPKFGGPSYAELETELRAAQRMAPRFDFAKDLLCEIDKRKTQEKNESEQRSVPAIAVFHHPQRTQQGWQVSETTNFRIFHNQAKDYAEAVARIAEHTRGEMQKKWFGANGPEWNPRCEIFLYATGEEYSRATNTPPQSPGHSYFQFDEKSGRLISRRMDLHCDNLNLLNYVLPHETTHTVLAGNFGEKPIPRWADEGMAVLTEPRDKIEAHLRNLPQHRRGHELFPLRQLLQMPDYPDPGYVGAFYAESVSIVDYLVGLKGPLAFTQFLREGMYSGYEQALQKHYGLRNFTELEEQWVQFAFEGVRPRAVLTGREKTDK
jgi:hypothetical protein